MDLSSDPNDPFSFEALEATFARERAEREAAERRGAGAVGGVGSAMGPAGGDFPHPQQQADAYEPDDLYGFEDEPMAADVGSSTRDWQGSGVTDAYDDDIFAPPPAAQQTYASPPLRSFQLAPTRPVPNRSSFNPPVLAGQPQRQPSLPGTRLPTAHAGPSLTQGNFVSALELPSQPSSQAIPSSSRAPLAQAGGGVYACQHSNAHAGRLAQVPMEDVEDEFEREFGDGTALRDVDEDDVLSRQRAGTSDRRNALLPPQPPAHDNRPPAPRGDRLVPVSALPDRYRSFFKFGVFNAVQSKCFDTAVNRDDNMVVSSPTGSGKTVVFELAIIRLLEAGEFGKAVYLAPTKSLCAERARDWSAKFAGIGIKCAEMTSDTTWGAQAFQPMHDARILICTPEKWDSITRWKGGSKESKLLDSVALFMIDEVHLLREKRGSVLEVVVARMKALSVDVRFLALSATVPNVADVGRWLRPPSASESRWVDGEVDVEQIPSAKVLTFGDEYRPCKLTRKIVAFPKKDGTNAFMFVKTLEKKVFELLTAHGEGKPVLIFCPTRKIVESCAEQLFKDIEQAGDRRGRLPWKTSKALLGSFTDKKLQRLASKGIAFHHAGLSIEDRRLVEMSFTQGSIMVVVSTSTLAVGVNLPAHTVVILGTQGYTSGVGMTDYSDLDIIQMIGRAGRPQFDKTGLALILTAQGQERKFDAVAGGTTILESSLHENLIEHLNSETALGTITDIPSAIGWLHSSFFYIRLLRNPAFYVKSLGAAFKVKEGPARALELFVRDAFKSLNEAGLVESDEGDDAVLSTGLGEVMSKRYIRFGTMKRILAIPDKVTFRDLLETLCEAEEFEDVRLRADEKTGYKEAGRSDRMRFAVKDIKSTKDKVLVIVQMVCGGHALADIKVDSQPVMQSLSVFRHAPRIAQTILDVGLLKESGSIVKYGLELLRSMNSKAFETGTCIFRILDKIGEKALQVFAQNRITTFAELSSDPRRIERLLNRNPPFGTQIVEQIKALPKFTLEVVEHDTRSFGGEAPVEVDLEITVSATVGKQHKKKGQSLTISCLVVTSDLGLVDFRRSQIKHFKTPQSYEVTALLTRPSQIVHILITCNEIAGVSSFANYHPAVAAAEYPAPDTRPKKEAGGGSDGDDEFERLVDDVALAAVDLDEIGAGSHPPTRTGSKDEEADRLPNGRYACHHACKNKSACGHACCREGLRNPRRMNRTRSGGSNEGEGEGVAVAKGGEGQSQQAPASQEPSTAEKVIKGRPSAQAAQVRGEGSSANTEKQRPAKRAASPADGGDDARDVDTLSAASLRGSFVKPKQGKVSAPSSARPAPARMPAATAAPKARDKPAAAMIVSQATERRRVLTPPSERSNEDDERAVDDADFPSAARAITQTLTSGKAKLARLAYHEPSEPAPASSTQVPSTFSGRPGKRARTEPSPPPLPQPQQHDDRRPSSDEYDDLLDFDLGSISGGAGGGIGGGETVDRASQQAEPLFMPASAPSSSPAARHGQGGDVEMAGLALDDDPADGGQETDLDLLLDLNSFGRSPPSKRRRVEEAAPAQGGEGSGGGNAQARTTRTAVNQSALPSSSSARNERPPGANLDSSHSNAGEGDNDDVGSMDTLKWMAQFVVD